MKTITPMKLTCDDTLNKILLTNLSLEDYFGEIRPIDVIEDLFKDRKLCKSEVKEILYSKYQIDRHIHEYCDDTLAFLAKLGCEPDKICKTECKGLVKYYLVQRRCCLEELAKDKNPRISQFAKLALDDIRLYSQYKKPYFDLFMKLDQTLCDAYLLWGPITVCEVKSRMSSRYCSEYVCAYGKIRYSRNKYSFAIKISSDDDINVSEWDLYRLQKIFDKVRVKKSSLCLQKSNLSLERVVDLVHLFFEYLD